MSKRLTQEAVFDRLKGASIDGSNSSASFAQKTTAAIMAAGALSMAAPAEAGSLEAKSSLLGGKRTAQATFNVKTQQQRLTSDLNLNGLRNGSVSLDSEVARLQSEAIESQPKQITANNIDTLFETKQSGVYQNPLKPEHTLTLHFLDDNNAAENIKSDIKRYGMNQESYTKHTQLQPQILSALGNAPEANLSMHIQIMKKDKADAMQSDANLTYIDTRDDTLLSPLTDNYDRYYLMTHEAAHALPSQQMTVNDLMSLDKDGREAHTFFKENSADYIATAKMAQAMLNDGKNLDDINNKIDTLIDRRKNEYADTQSVFNTGNLSDAPPGEKVVGESDHYSAPTLAVVKKVLNNDPEHFKAATNEQIIEEANAVSSSLMRYNFLPSMEAAYRNGLLENDKPLAQAIETSKSASTADSGVNQLGNIRNGATQHILSHYTSDYGGFAESAASDILQRNAEQSQTNINSPFEMVR